MKKQILRFGIPQNITAGGPSGIVIQFPYTVVDAELVGSSREKAQTSDHTLDVDISLRALICWNLCDGNMQFHYDDIVKVLFEMSKNRLRQLGQKGVLPKRDTFKVRLETHPPECPVDPKRVGEPNGAVVEIQVR